MKCSEVTFEMGDGSYESESPWYEAEIGDLIWDTKGGGHILVRHARCGERIPEGERGAGAQYDCGCGGYPLTNHSDEEMVLVCDCGEDDSWRDHHYFLLARRSS